MDKKSHTSREVLEWMRSIQIERIYQLRLFEKVHRKLTHNGWREILTLLKLNEEIEKSNVDTSQTLETDRSGDQQGGASGITKSLKDLDHMDRRLLRQAVKEIVRNLTQETEVESERSIDSDEEQRRDEDSR